MSLVEVHRSPIRLFLIGVVALLLVLAAADVMWLHRLSTPPEVVDGVLTTQGENQRRADYLWGVPMLLSGTVLFGYAVFTLWRREPVLVVREDGVEFALGRPGEAPVFVPWSAIADVYTAADRDPDGGASVDIVVFDLVDTGSLPGDPYDAEWDGFRLKVNAASWERRPEDVVVHAKVAMEASHRNHRVKGEQDD